MRITMQRGDDCMCLNHTQWNSFLRGDAVDDRGRAIAVFGEAHSTRNYSISYDPIGLRMTLGDHECSVDEFSALVASLQLGPTIIDVTTLSAAEIAICCKAFRYSPSSILSLIYVEPIKYRRSKSAMVLHRRDFELSGESQEFTAVPGSAVFLGSGRQVRVVFLLGFEGHRLDRAFEQTPLDPRFCTVILGVPAFQAGWEMDAFANNVPVLLERGLSNNVLFAGAQNPVAAIRAIMEVYQACSAEKGERLVIVPIGTEPHGIAAALFACEHTDVGIMYDYPAHVRMRSDGVASWHLFDVEF